MVSAALYRNYILYTVSSLYRTALTMARVSYISNIYYYQYYIHPFLVWGKVEGGRGEKGEEMGLVSQAYMTKPVLLSPFT